MPRVQSYEKFTKFQLSAEILKIESLIILTDKDQSIKESKNKEIFLKKLTFLVSLYTKKYGQIDFPMRALGNSTMECVLFLKSGFFVNHKEAKLSLF